MSTEYNFPTINQQTGTVHLNNEKGRLLIIFFTYSVESRNNKIN